MSRLAWQPLAGSINWGSGALLTIVSPPSLLMLTTRWPPLRLFSIRLPSPSSATAHSLEGRKPAIAPTRQLWPPSSESSRWEALPAPATLWRAGTTIRPAAGASRFTIPWPGPMPYHGFQPGSRTWSVMSRERAQLSPSSSEWVTRRKRLPRSASRFTEAFHIQSSRIRPPGSTTGRGILHGLGPSLASTCRGAQLRPPSLERRSSTSMLPSSRQLSTRPPQKASTVPRSLTASPGVR